jgi:hypothetical protein
VIRRGLAHAQSALAQFDGHLLDGLAFCSQVYALYESIRGGPDGVARMRMRPYRVDKKLLDELMPICRYVQASYRPGRYISVRWADGNQQCDAEIRQRGAYVGHNFYPAKGYLEVTCTMHPKEYLSRELLEKKGGGFGVEGMRRLKGGDIESVPVGYSNMDFVDAYAELLLKQVAKKTRAPFPRNTTLIIQCTLNLLPYSPDEWSLLLSKVRPTLLKTSFREIYLYDTLYNHSDSVFPA